MTINELIEKMILTNEMYTDFINETIETKGWKIADTANKLALEMNAITTEMYSNAARLIVNAYLA